MIANRWIEQGYNAGLVLHSVGLLLPPTTVIKLVNQRKLCLSLMVNQSHQRGMLGAQYEAIPTYIGQKVSDEQIKEFIMEEISGDGYPYGYKKLYGQHARGLRAEH